MEDPKTPGRPPDLVREIVQGHSASQRSERHRWSSEIIESALLEASRIQLEAFQSGERMYQELVGIAEARAKEILEEARLEAQRIVADAQERSSTLHTTGRGGDYSEATLEALRMEVAAIGRKLQRPPQGEELTSELSRFSLPGEWATPDSGADTIVSAPIPSNSTINRESVSSDQPSIDGAQSPGRMQGNPTRRVNGCWVPPEWISAE